MGKRDEVRRDRGVLRLLLHAVDEGAVDLDHVHREVAQLAERGEAGAEVVDRDADAVLVQRVQLDLRALPRRPFVD